MRKVESTARPLRVAYLIDLDDCADELLDAVFAECYSRLGGRRTLIVPVKTDSGIDPSYQTWLECYDPDIIYSYADLSKKVVKGIHEKYCPLSLDIHEKSKADSNKFYVPNLPQAGLCSLSVFPFLLDKSGLSDFSNTRVLDCDFSVEPNRFLTDNFGIPSKSYPCSIVEKYPKLYKALTFIPEDYRQPYGESEGREYITDYSNFINHIATGKKIQTLSMLSDYLSWRLNFTSLTQSKSFNLVIGNSVSDRLLFWNFHQHYTYIDISEIVDLIISPNDLESPDFLNVIQDIIRKKSRRSHSGYPITIRSFSLSEQELKECSEKICKQINGARPEIQKIDQHEDYLPKFDRACGRLVSFTSSTNWNEPKNTEVDTFLGKQVSIPKTCPIHLKDITVPAGLRSGVWMVDLYIEREETHSNVLNVNHIWDLPRRIRIDTSFRRLDENSRNNQDLYLKAIRVTRDTLPSIPLQYEMDAPVFQLPDDIDAIENAVVNLFRKKSLKWNVEISDKGRYFLGTMQYFVTISIADEILMNKFWYKIFCDYLGASPKSFSEENVKILLQYIDEKIVQNIEKFFKNKDTRRHFAERCLRVSSQISREKRSISWKQIKEFFLNEELNSNDLDEGSRVEEVEKSTQFLCRRKILFQGQEWKCKTCLYKNWESIGKIKAILVCRVCGNEESPPISDDWKFRLNEFLLEAMRQHGTMALIWCLIQLCNQANSSFYFIPSVTLFNYNKKDKREQVAEIDLMAVIDGKFYVCEVKSSVRSPDLKKFIDTVNILRPDVAVLAVMESDKDKKIRKNLFSKLQDKIDDGIKIEIFTLQEDHFDDTTTCYGERVRYRL